MLQKQRKARSCGLYKHELKVHGQKQTDTTIRIAKCRMPLRKTQALPHNDECSHQIKNIPIVYLKLSQTYVIL